MGVCDWIPWEGSIRVMAGWVDTKHNWRLEMPSHHSNMVARSLMKLDGALENIIYSHFFLFNPPGLYVGLS